MLHFLFQPFSLCQPTLLQRACLIVLKVKYKQKKKGQMTNIPFPNAKSFCTFQILHTLMLLSPRSYPRHPSSAIVVKTIGAGSTSWKLGACFVLCHHCRSWPLAWAGPPLNCSSATHWHRQSNDGVADADQRWADCVGLPFCLREPQPFWRQRGQCGARSIQLSEQAAATVHTVIVGF